MQIKKIYIGIDPGTGSSSGLGFAAIDRDTRRILLATTLWTSKQTKRADAWIRIRELIAALKEGIELIAPVLDTVYIESFVMRGRGGETLARLVGGVITAIPNNSKFIEIPNTRVKKLVGGKGTDDKLVVARALLIEYPLDVDLIQNLIDREDFDALDALAIVTAGLKYGNK